MNDEDLHARLRQAHLTIEFPQDFSREIWGRIEAAELTGAQGIANWSNWCGKWLGWLARPVPAVAVAVLMGATGCGLAVLQGHRHVQRLAESAYLKSVSPFAAAHLDNLEVRR
jgi:hypothetical protein